MRKNKSLKIIIDTNLWISFIISNKLDFLDSLLYSRKIKLLFSRELIVEIEQTTQKPKLRKYFLGNGFEEMLLIIEPFVTLIEVRNSVDICRDPNDNFLLALAKTGKADYLLTGDKDLLELKNIGKTKIITISDFLTIEYKTS